MGDNYLCEEGFTCCDDEIIPPEEYDCLEEGYSCVGTGECIGDLLGSSYVCEDELLCCDNETEPPPEEDCAENGYFCVGEGNCLGTEMGDFNCPNSLICCDSISQNETCSDLGGTICEYGSHCKEGSETVTNDLAFGETCCLTENDRFWRR